ncbi:Protein of unknown function [Klenkia marina]|uniref:DUF3105 domain-containing protein n=1 Tax=Klenkia marina TaxID=1960309 RepID=A0A1G4YCL7_9ACTN|nr:DUF3105 domain-containing protein [Klenkia marina]SCX51236.1 Protein of unknown function [Klenkia marina]
MLPRRVLPGVLPGLSALVLLAGCGGGGPEVVETPYTGGQHTAGPVDYAQTPPVGGPHDPQWADCTGSVYAAPIRPENAVHSLEHGAVWITYDPDRVDADDLAALVGLVEGQQATMLSPYPGQPTPVSLQAWAVQLALDELDTDAVEDFLTEYRLAPDGAPEPGASCEMPDFLDRPLAPGDASNAA